MADPPPYPNTGEESDREPISSAPLSLKVVGLIVIVLLLALFVILRLASGGLQGLHQ